MIVAAVLVAAGSGARLGAEVPKAFVTVAGRPLLARAVARFVAHPRVRDVLVAAPPELVAAAADLVPAATVVAGGATRQESVARALAALRDDVEFVLVHDVARPFVPAAVIDRVIDALQRGAAAAVPVLPVADTLRRAGRGEVLGALVDRDGLLAMQTPQGFRRDLLAGAHAAAVAASTDDAALVQDQGLAVHAVAGDPLAFKITVPFDLDVAEAVAARE